ncbi:MAG: hypothetical protein WB630_10335 [Candidatus Acidiferrales bacterium]
MKLGDYFSILRYRNIGLCCLGAAGFISWLFLSNVFAPLYITEVAHQAPTTAGFLLGASGLGSFIVGFLLPSLSDRLGRKPVLLAMAAMSSLVPLALLISPLYAYPLTAEQRAQLLGIAEKCPVHRTLKSEIDIRRWLA